MNKLIIYNGEIAKQSVDIQDLIRDFLVRRSDKTRKAYETDLNDFARFLNVGSPQIALGALVSGDQGRGNGLVLAFKNGLLDRHLSPSTINRKLATIRSAIKLANRLGLVNWEIKIENERVETYRDTKGTGKDGLRAILKQALNQKNYKKSVRDTAIIRLLFDLALRREEVVRLDISDYEQENDVLMVMGKGRSQKIALSVPEPTKKALLHWIGIRGEVDGPMFVNFDHAGKGNRLTGTAIYYIVRSLGKAAGIKARPHGLRHAAITEALDLTNGNFREVQRYSRHKNIQTVLAYDDNRQDKAGEIAKKVASSV